MNEHMNTRDRRIFEALDGIDEKYIAEVTERYEVFDPLASYAPTRRAKRRMYTRLAAFAACLVLVALCLPALARVLQQYGIIGSGTEVPSTTVETPETPPPETVAPEVTDTPDTDEITPELTDWTVPPEEPGVFESYESIIKLLDDISNICFESGNISGDRSKYEATLNFADEKEREWFGKIFDSAIDGRYGSELPYGYSIGDINGDGINELLFLREDYKVLSVFTLSDGKPVMLDSFGYRRKGKIDTEGVIYTFENVFSETVPQYGIYKIAGGSLEMVDALGRYDVGETRFFYRIRNGERESVESQEYYDLAKKSPFKTEISIFNEDNPGVKYIGFETDSGLDTDLPKDPVDPTLRMIYENVFAGRRKVYFGDGLIYLAKCPDLNGIPVCEWKNNRIAYIDYNGDDPPEVLMAPESGHGAYILYYSKRDDTVYAYYISSEFGYTFYADGTFGYPESAVRKDVSAFRGPTVEYYDLDYKKLGLTLKYEEPEWTPIEIADPERKKEDLKYFRNYDEIIEILEDISYHFDGKSYEGTIPFEEYAAKYSFDNMTEKEWMNDVFHAAHLLNYSRELGYGYSLGDINGDGTDELVYLLRDHTVLAIFTMCEGQPRLLDAFWDRYRGYINEQGYILTFGSDSAFGSSRIVYEISPNNRELDVVAELHINYDDSGEANIYYNVFDADGPSYITEEELKAIENADPFMKESDIKTEKNKGISFVSFEYEQPALGYSELVSIFGETFNGYRTVEFAWGTCTIPNFCGVNKRLYECTRPEAAFIDLDGDGMIEAILVAEDEAEFILDYDARLNKVYGLELFPHYGYTYYANGEYGYDTLRYRISSIKGYDFTVETIDYKALGQEPSRQKPEWSIVGLGGLKKVGLGAANAVYSEYMLSTTTEENSYIYLADGNHIGPFLNITPVRTITNVRLYKLDAGMVEYELGELLYQVDKITPSKSLVAGVVFYGDMTAYGIVYEEGGKEYYRAITLSDGYGYAPIEVSEFTPANIGSFEGGVYTVGDGVTEIADGDLYRANEEEIRELIIGANVKKIDLSYINRFENLKKISVHGDNKYFATWETEDGATVLISKYSNEMLFLPAENDYVDLGYRRSAVSNNYKQSTDIDMYVGGKEVTESELDNYKMTLQMPLAEFLPIEVEWQVKDVIWGG